MRAIQYLSESDLIGSRAFEIALDVGFVSRPLRSDGVDPSAAAGL